MEADYPAAHSMDSIWFAVDADGHVASFGTGENGHMPQSDQGDGFDLLRRMEQALGAGVEEDDEYVDIVERGEKIGLFYYSHPEKFVHPIDPYDREAIPDKPLHVDQLPPVLRQEVRKVTFSRVRFQDTDRLQPLEFVPCDAWNPDACAYLCPDGKTVRPIPGEEAMFADFVEEFLAEEPAAKDRFIFDGPLERADEDAEEE